jgi:hypothetical protein
VSVVPRWERTFGIGGNESDGMSIIYEKGF